MLGNDNHGLVLPSERWLANTNEKLAKEGMVPSRRPMEAYRRWCMESQQHIGFGGEATRVISEWFSKNTQYGKEVQKPFRRSAYFYDVSFWEVSLPLAYGTVQINPLKQLRGMPAYLVDRLAKDPVAGDEYFEHFDSTYNFFVEIEHLEMLKREGEQRLYQDFLVAADRHLLSATALLLDGNTKAIEDCRHVLELSLKAVLNAFKGIEEAQFKRNPFNHGLPSTFQAAAECVAPAVMPITVYDLSLFPGIEVRYKATRFSPQELWQGFMLSQRLATFCLEQVLNHLNRSG